MWEVAVIGSAGAIGTEVEITISPYIKEKMLALSKKLSSLRDRPEENAALIKKLSETLQDYENQLEEQINRTLLGETGAPRHIVAFRKVFAGAYIRIPKKSLTVVDEMDKVSFSILDGELVTDSYKTD
jgi:phosphate uptake regulator